MQVEHTSEFLFRYIKVVCLPTCTQAAFLPCYTKGMLQKTKVMHLKKKVHSLFSFQWTLNSRSFLSQKKLNWGPNFKKNTLAHHEGQNKIWSAFKKD